MSIILLLVFKPLKSLPPLTLSKISGMMCSIGMPLE